MGQRGPKSKADQAVIPRPDAGNVTVNTYPSPPVELTQEQAEEWLAVTYQMPADWFTRETHGTLTQLCRHRIRARRLAELLNDMERSEGLDMKEYRDLLRTEGENTRIIASCETKLRLTPQTTYSKGKAKTTPFKPPWAD